MLLRLDWYMTLAMSTQNFLVLLVLLMLMLRNVLTIVWSRFWRCLAEILNLKFEKMLKLKFGQDFEAEVWPTSWSWLLVNILRLKFDWNSEAELLSRFWFWSWSSVEILRLKFGIDSKAEFSCYLRAVTFVEELHPWVRCVFGNAFTFFSTTP